MSIPSKLSIWFRCGGVFLIVCLIQSAAKASQIQLSSVQSANLSNIKTLWLGEIEKDHDIERVCETLNLDNRQEEEIRQVLLDTMETSYIRFLVTNFRSEVGPDVKCKCTAFPALRNINKENPKRVSPGKLLTVYEYYRNKAASLINDYFDFRPLLIVDSEWKASRPPSIAYERLKFLCGEEIVLRVEKELVLAQEKSRR